MINSSDILNIKRLSLRHLLFFLHVFYVIQNELRRKHVNAYLLLNLLTKFVKKCQPGVTERLHWEFCCWLSILVNPFFCMGTQKAERLILVFDFPAIVAYNYRN